jgi:hypothetical protein
MKCPKTSSKVQCAKCQGFGHSFVNSTSKPLVIKEYKDCRTCAASRRKHPPSKSYLMWQMWGDKEFLSLINEKLEWESPPSILVTRNPNWSQRLGTGTGCVKGMY